MLFVRRSIDSLIWVSNLRSADWTLFQFGLNLFERNRVEYMATRIDVRHVVDRIAAERTVAETSHATREHLAFIHHELGRNVVELRSQLVLSITKKCVEPLHLDPNLVQRQKVCAQVMTALAFRRVHPPVEWRALVGRRR